MLKHLDKNLFFYSILLLISSFLIMPAYSVSTVSFCKSMGNKFSLGKLELDTCTAIITEYRLGEIPWPIITLLLLIILVAVSYRLRKNSFGHEEL